MIYQEITPYLNKMVHVKLKNKKRKVGWLVINNTRDSEELIKEVHCVHVRFGEKFAHTSQPAEWTDLKQKSKIVQLEDILSIRSCI